MPPSLPWNTTTTAAISSVLVAAVILSQQQRRWNSTLLPSEPTKKEITNSAPVSKLVVPGIWNTGNTCFMNALLQALAASPSTCNYLQHLDELLEAEVLYSGNSSPSADAFSRALYAAVQELQVRHIASEDGGSSVSGVLSRIGAAIKPSLARSAVVLDLSGLEKKLRFISKTFARPHEQQDADELLTITLDVLEKESKHAWRVLAPSLKSLGLDSLLKDTNGVSPEEELSKGNTHWWGPSSPPTNDNVGSRIPLRMPLEGTLLSLIQCERCKRKSPLRPTPFNVLSLPIPGRGCSLEDCLREFVKPELVEDVECPRCSATPGIAPKQRARKRLMIGRLPGVLCLRLQRNLFDTRAGYMYKDQTLVGLPAVLNASDACFFSVLAKEEKSPSDSVSPWKTDLNNGPDVSTNSFMFALSGNLPPLLSAKSASEETPKKPYRPSVKVKASQFEERNTEFRLVAVIEHLGSAFGGHYVAYRRIETDKDPIWMRCSDDVVMPTLERNVLESTQAYMCIYERANKDSVN